MSRIIYFLTLLLLTINSILLSRDIDVKKEHGFVGTKACKKCHIKQYKSWAKTNMANAYNILKPGERSEAKKRVSESLVDTVIGEGGLREVVLNQVKSYIENKVDKDFS